MLPILQIGPLAIQTPGLILLAGVWIGLTLAERAAPAHKINPSLVYNVAFTALVAGLAGARLAYLARFPSAFAASPRSLISLNPGLLDPLGGGAVGLIAAVVYGQRKRLPFWRTLDALTPALAMLYLAIPLANLASGAAFGAVTDVPWAINLWGAQRHPAQIYETLAAALILWAVWPGRATALFRTEGGRFFLFLALAAAARLFLEPFRASSPALFNGIRLIQLAAWVLLGLGLWQLGRRVQRRRTSSAR